MSGKADISESSEKPLRRGRYIFGDPERTRPGVQGVYSLLLIGELVVAPVALAVTFVLLVACLGFRVRRSLGLWVALIGAVVVLAVGLADAVAGYGVGPRALLDFVVAVPGAAQRGGLGPAWREATAGWWPGWVLGQLPIALVLGGVQAWWQSLLVWLHTDEWLVKPARKGLIGWVRQWLLVWAIKRWRLLGSDDRTLLGVDKSSGRPLWLFDVERRGHVFVVGATGSGKTTTAFKLAQHDVRRGRPVLAVDLKGSPQLRSALGRCADEAGRAFAALTLDGGAWWDPFRIGTAEERRDMLVGSHDWTDAPAYYVDVAMNFTQIVLAVLDATGHLAYESTLREMIRCTGLADLAQRANQIPAADPRRADLHLRIRRLTADVMADKDALVGFRTKLEIFANSGIGQWMRVPEGPRVVRDGVEWVQGCPVLDLARFRRENAVAVISLNSIRDASMSARVGRVAVQAITATFGLMLEEGDSRPTLVFVDEFSALGGDVMTNLLSRGREAGAEVLLITQTIEDLEIAADQRAAVGRLLSLVPTVLAHRVGDEEAAKRVAAVAATKQWVKERLEVRRTRGLAAVQRGATTGEDLVDIDPMYPVVKPGTLQDLTTGHFVLVARGRSQKRVIQQAYTVDTGELSGGDESVVEVERVATVEVFGELDLSDLLGDGAEPPAVVAPVQRVEVGGAVEERLPSGDVVVGDGESKAAGMKRIAGARKRPSGERGDVSN